MHVVFIDLYTEDLRVTLYVVPLGVGLKRLLDDGILEPGGQFRRMDQVVDNTLTGDREGGRAVRKSLRICSDNLYNPICSTTAVTCHYAHRIIQKHTLLLGVTDVV